MALKTYTAKAELIEGLKVRASARDFSIVLDEPLEQGGTNAGMNPIELAAWTHAEFVRIHPFPDGNGRTSRLIMNYQLLANGFPAVSIAKENRLDYFNALEAYATEGNLVPFAEMVADLADQQLDRYLGMMEPSQDIQQNPKM